MRKFLQAFDSGLGATTKLETELGYGSGGGSYGLQSIDRDVYKSAKTTFRPDLSLNEHVTIISTQGRVRPAESRSIESDSSGGAIIKRTQQWDVSVEETDQGSEG